MFFAALLCVAAPSYAKAVKVIEPLSTEVIAASHIVATDITIGDSAQAVFNQLEQYAAEKRQAEKLPPVSATDARATADQYATLPFATMAPFLIEDTTREWGLSGGRPVKLAISIDVLKTADAGMAILLGSADQLSGDVVVTDAESGAKLGEFYVDVLNFRAGLLGLALRGGGVREKLTAEFAKHISQQLSGKKSKPQAGKKA